MPYVSKSIKRSDEMNKFILKPVDSVSVTLYKYINCVAGFDGGVVSREYYQAI